MVCPDCGGNRVHVYPSSVSAKLIVYCDDCAYEVDLSKYEKAIGVVSTLLEIKKEE